MIKKITDMASFIHKLLKSPKTIGAVAPSSKRLCRAMIKAIGVDKNTIYVEVGVGTGVMTQQLIEAGIAQENMYLFENELGFIEKLKQQFPKAHVIHGDVQHLQKYLSEMGVEKTSKIISSLPFKSLPKIVGENILSQFNKTLTDDGKIVQFTYGINEPYPKTFKTTHSFTVSRQAYIPQNIPPATVWLYSKTK